jgi:hypothetical protein
MRRYFEFWWKCICIAAKDKSAFANDWQWLFGIPIGGAAGRPSFSSRQARVRQFVESTKGKLKLFFLPPYSPELNPDELAWNDVKNNGVGRALICSPVDLEHVVHSRLMLLQKSPERVRASFRSEETRYAAA